MCIFLRLVVCWRSLQTSFREPSLGWFTLILINGLSEINLLSGVCLLPSLEKTVSSLAIFMILTFFDGLSSSLKYKPTESVFLQYKHLKFTFASLKAAL